MVQIFTNMELKYFLSLEFTYTFVVVNVLLIAMANSFSLNTVYSQPYSSNTTTQSWIDNLNNIKVQFRYIPDKPTIDTPTELKFSVQNLHTDDPVKNLLARVAITSSSSGQQRIFKFANITVPDGKFSVKYLFPDSGIYQVIYNIGSKNNFSSLGSFKVLVPLQAASSISNPFGLSPSIIIAIIIIIIAAVAAEAYFIIIKRREKIKYNL